jgi:hypothetical protein
MYRCVLAGLVAVSFVSPNHAAAQQFQAHLSGFEEVPAIVSDASGDLHLNLKLDGSALEYVLIYGNFDSTVIQAHIHIGQKGVNGAVSTFLCGPAAPAHQTCPQSGMVTGTITAADILNVPAQGVAAGQLDRFVRALKAGITYANIHTANHPGGEIRGQIKSVDDGLFNLPEKE